MKVEPIIVQLPNQFPASVAIAAPAKKILISAAYIPTDRSFDEI